MSRMIWIVLAVAVALLGSAGVATAADSSTCPASVVCAGDVVHVDNVSAELVHVDTLHVFG
jgi:hypothetical protein